MGNESPVRFGHTVGECLVAFAMLLPIAVLITKIGFQTETLNRESSLVQMACGDLVNARESIGTWDFESISKSKIESMTIPENIAFRDVTRSWHTIVEDVSEPIVARRITLSMQLVQTNTDIASEVGPLTFWVTNP